MVATQLILPGETVLQCAAANILAVPKTAAAVEGWQSWLQLYTSAHGPLAQQLQDFLADTSHSPTVRLASWLLYLRSACKASSSSTGTTPASSSSSDATPSTSHAPRPFWCSYIALLEACGPMTAVCSGAWGQQELQQLEPPVLKVWLCRHHADARRASLAAYALLAAGRHPVAQLGLADSSADVGWAMALVKTRAHGDAHRLALMPLHDMINHAERGTANCTPGPAAAASNAVGSGYSLVAAAAIQAGEELGNAYTPPRSNAQMLLGWGFSLPAKTGDWLLAVPLWYGVLPLLPWQAALRAAAAVAIRHEMQQEQLQSVGEQLSAAEVLARLASAAASLPLMLPDSIWDGGSGCRAAAAAFAQQVSLGSEGQQQQQQQQHQGAYQPLHGSLLQREKVEALFARDLALHLQQQTPGATEVAGVELAGRQQQQQQHQAWAAAVLQLSCLGQLAACRTTAEQDAQLLVQLQQQHPHTPNSINLLLQQQQQQADAASQHLLQQFEELQQQLVQALALSAAYSNLRSICDATAESAQVVLSALQPQVQQLEQQLGLPAWHGRGGGRPAAAAAVAQHCLGCVPQLLQQQDALLRRLGQLEQQRQQQLSSQLGRHHADASSDAAGAAGAGESGPGLAAGMSHERLAAAVAARLDQKQLLAVGGELCAQLQQLLAGTAAGM
uniref:SET domain-containing protein n=1 Tax=Tetradesmus obliquus TaxID=3088 RepID=A0A383W455_TETOB|eukprot:jgi/Sobl393_1/17204/SZX72261.1